MQFWLKRYSQMAPAKGTPGAVPEPPPGGGSPEAREMTEQGQVNARNIDGDIQQGIVRPLTDLLAKDVAAFLDLVANGDQLAKFMVGLAVAGKSASYIRAISSYNDIKGTVLSGSPNGMVSLGQWAMGLQSISQGSPFDTLLTRILQAPGVLENQRR